MIIGKKKKKLTEKESGRKVGVFSDAILMILNFTLELLKQKTEKQKFGSRSLEAL